MNAEENERLTRVGPGTPCGELMRRYWHPIAAASQLPEHGTKAIRLLEEDLVLYRDREGGLGLIEPHCAHRGAGLMFGMPEAHGLRCPYHGWLYDATGQCIEQPFEAFVDPNNTFRDRIRLKALPIGGRTAICSATARISPNAGGLLQGRLGTSRDRILTG